MGSLCGDELQQWDVHGSGDHEEKIFVAIRLRPLNEREITRNDVSDWECINSTTLIYKNGTAERSMVPTAYTFDRVFGCDCSTREVYNAGAKSIALSVVSGINSTVFAYGQTSSGKTYTMSGITEYTLADIFDHIHRHDDREFVLKFSAIEIYNEAVRDLLSPDNTPLRLLDDPERGTVVEKLIEETLRDWSHLKELLSICESQRQIGETSLNEMSSRSHQILRLTIESSARQLQGAENPSTLTAYVNFVDLAGSERASQTLSAGVRLKEGSHINRSLLTLGTVIRKLSKGRNGHIPYRDSKLTRILQNSLGGNARTAIICTMSPARSQVEQSRNALVFASCAKQVNTNSRVNVVMSDKALVKKLKRELARLESELKGLGSSSTMPSSVAQLKEKELLIEKMDKEIKELKTQRDHAQSRIEDLMRSASDCQTPGSMVEPNQLLRHGITNAWLDEYPASVSSDMVDPLRSDITSVMSHHSSQYDVLNSNRHDIELPDYSDDHFLSDDISPRLVIDKLFGPDPSRGWEMINGKHGEYSEDHCKEVQCIEVEESNLNRNFKSEKISSEDGSKNSNYIHMEPTYEALQRKIQSMQKTIEYLVKPYRKNQTYEDSDVSSEAGMSASRSTELARSRSCRAVLMPAASSPRSYKAEFYENSPPNGFEKGFPGRPESGNQQKLSRFKSISSIGELFGEESEISSVNGASMDQKEQDPKISNNGEVSSVLNSAAVLNDLAISEPEQQFTDSLTQCDRAQSCTKDLLQSVGDYQAPRSMMGNEIKRPKAQRGHTQSCTENLLKSIGDHQAPRSTMDIEIKEPKGQHGYAQSCTEDLLKSVGDCQAPTSTMDKEIKELKTQHGHSQSCTEDLLQSVGDYQAPRTMMDKEIKELKTQHGHAQSCVEDLLQPVRDYQAPSPMMDKEIKELKTQHGHAQSCVEDLLQPVRDYQAPSPMEQMDKEIKELKTQHGHAQSCVDDLLLPVRDYQAPSPMMDKEIKELKTQHGHTQSCVEDLLQPVRDYQAPGPMMDKEIKELKIQHGHAQSCIADFLNPVGDYQAPESPMNKESLKTRSRAQSCTEDLFQSVGDYQAPRSMAQEAKPTVNGLGRFQEDMGSDSGQGSPESPCSWPLKFQTQQREIIELWDACYVPLTHRTHFFLLFKGDPSDSVYMEVELRRLSFLKSTLTPASSKRALNRERQMLSRRVFKKFSAKERHALYEKWGIGVKSKQRRLQLCQRIWSNTKDMLHIKESAELVAKLVGFSESGQAPKEMFGLSLSSQPMKEKSSFSWSLISLI